MAKKIIKKENPLTLSELTKYHEKTLFPFLKENFVTKQEMESLVEIVATKEELSDVAKDVKEIKAMLVDSLDGSKKIETRVDFIESALNISVKSK